MKWWVVGVSVLVVSGWLASGALRGEEAAVPAGGPGESAVTVVGEPEVPGALSAEPELAKKLAATLSVQFVGTPLDQALEYLQNKGKVNIILNTDAPGVDPTRPIVLNLDGVTLRSAIAWTTRLAGLVYVARDEAVFVTTSADLSPEWAQQVRARDQGLDRQARRSWLPKLKAVLEEPTSFSFVRTPLREALRFLATLHKVNVVLDPAVAPPTNTLTMGVEEMSVRNALAWMLRIKHLGYTFVDEAVFVSTPERIRTLEANRRATVTDPRLRTVVNVEFSETSIQQALEALSEATGLNISLRAEQVPPLRLTLKMDNVTLERAVRELVAQTGLPFAFSLEKEGMVIWLQPTSRKSRGGQGPSAEEPPRGSPQAQ